MLNAEAIEVQSKSFLDNWDTYAIHIIDWNISGCIKNKLYILLIKQTLGLSDEFFDIDTI